MASYLHRLLVFFIFTLLTACQSAPVKDIHSPYFAPPVGSTLVLHTSIEIPARELSVVIQDGKIQPSSWQLDQYYAHCDFEMHEKVDKPVEVKPDQFKIIRVVRSIENVLFSQRIVARFGVSDGAPLEEYQTVMYLQSDKQPNVFRMTCKHWGDPSDEDQLSIVQIRKALGKMFSLKLPAEK